MKYSELTQEKKEEIADEYNLPVAALEAYEKLGIENEGDFDNIEEAYSGEFDSDKDFAMDMAEQTGDFDFKNQTWPQYCIDWDHAAKELMMDYSEQDGFYFRNL